MLAISSALRRKSAMAATALILGLSGDHIQAQELGMKIVGDEDNEFGLFIAQWMDAKDARLLAPVFIDEAPEIVDDWSLEMQGQARSAMMPAKQP